MRFALTFPRMLRVGLGASAELPDLLNGIDRVAIIGGRGDTADLIGEMLVGADRAIEIHRRHGEPMLSDVASLAGVVAEFGPDAVVGVGGGSAIDSAKAVAALVANPSSDPLEFFEGGGRVPRALEHSPLPVFAAPTTAGTGSEATANAVMNLGTMKASLRDPRLIPVGAVVDAELGARVPAEVQVSAALDAAVQLVEAYATPLGNPLTWQCALTGARLGLPVLSRIIDGSASDADRQAMATAAMMSGIALANSKLGTIHGFAGVLGGRIGVAHGVLCGLLAGPVLRSTVRQMRASGDLHDALTRYGELAAISRGQATAHPEELAEWFDELVAAAGLGSLALDRGEWSETIGLVGVASSTKGNPVPLSRESMETVLAEATRTGGADE